MPLSKYIDRVQAGEEVIVTDQGRPVAALFVGAAVFTSADRTLCEAAARPGLHIADPMA